MLVGLGRGRYTLHKERRDGGALPVDDLALHDFVLCSNDDVGAAQVWMQNDCFPQFRAGRGKIRSSGDASVEECLELEDIFSA